MKPIQQTKYSNPLDSYIDANTDLMIFIDNLPLSSKEHKTNRQSIVSRHQKAWKDFTAFNSNQFLNLERLLNNDDDKIKQLKASKRCLIGFCIIEALVLVCLLVKGVF